MNPMRSTSHFCFSSLGLHRVAAQCDSRNGVARRLLARAGLRFEGEFVQDRFIKGEWVNSVRYAILDAEYLAAPDGPAR